MLFSKKIKSKGTNVIGKIFYFGTLLTIGSGCELISFPTVAHNPSMSVIIAQTTGSTVESSAKNFKEVNPAKSFTPNGDGTNDTWMVLDDRDNKGYKASVIIFDRWGNMVYGNDNYKNDWNGTYKGKSLPSGNYYAKIDITYPDGTKKTISTFLNLIR